MLEADAKKPKRKKKDKVMSTEFRGVVVGSEDEIQAYFFKWVTALENRFPVLKRFHAIPNGGGRTKFMRYLLSITGLRSGVPDTFLPVPAPGYSGLYIEFKRPGEYPSKEQREWIDFLTSCGFKVVVCRSWIEAANVVIDYLKLPIIPFKL